MKEKLAIAGIVVLLVTIGLSGCFEGEQQSIDDVSGFIGTWDGEDFLYWHHITFFSNETFKWIAYQKTESIAPPLLFICNGTYEITKNNVEEPYQGILLFKFLNETNTLISTSNTYYFSNNNTFCLLLFHPNLLRLVPAYNMPNETCFTKRQSE